MVQTSMNLGMMNATTDRNITSAARMARSGFFVAICHATLKKTPGTSKGSASEIAIVTITTTPDQND
jgi:hypothetical protein